MIKVGITFQTAPISELPSLGDREGSYYKNCYFNNLYLPYSDPSLVSKEIKNLRFQVVLLVL